MRAVSPSAVVFAFLLAITSAGFVPAQRAEAAVTFVTISGRITDAATGQPIVGACVAITTDDTQYAVVVEGNGGQVVVVVKEIAFSGGDAALMYEGFPGP